ncbi:MAG: hypothetical protein AAFM92_13830 [Pseudomonadota bacterium]
MTKKTEMNINVTSGSVAVGSATQGDRNKIVSDASTKVTESDAAWVSFVQHLEESAKDAKVSEAEIEELKAKVKKLHDESQKPGFIEKSGEILELIFKAYGWASAPLRSLFAK